MGALGLGAAGSAAALAVLPLPPEDPLRSTLALLPLLLAGFHALAQRVEAAGGRRLAERHGAGQLAALAVLAGLAVARPHLGLPPRSAEILAAGFLLVLIHRLAVQLPAMRPLLGRRLPRQVPAVFFFLPLLAYLAILPWSAGHHPPDGDEPFYLLMTHSLAYDLDADLTNNYAAEDWRSFMDRPIEPQPGDPVGPHGELYSRHNMLLPMVLAPAYRVAGAAGALTVMALLAAALGWITLRLARHYASEHPGEAFAAYALVAFASPLVLYSYQVWVEVPAALLAAFALDQILALERVPAPGRLHWGRHQWLGIGVPILLLPLVKLRFMLVALPLLALAWWHAGRPKKPLILLAVLLAAVGGGLLIHNQIVYDNPLKIHTWEELELYHYRLGDYLEGSVGLFWDSAFGLFGAAPIWMLLIPATGLLIHRRHRLLAHLGVLALPYMLVVTPRPEWYGGWSPPFRYALLALPLAGLGLVPLLVQRRRGGARALIAALGLATFALMLLWLVVPGWTYNFADGRTYLLDHLNAHLGADAARLFPSAVRPRLATWVWTLVSLAAVPALWWGLPRRWPRAGLWGAAGLLAASALVPVAAEKLPTRVVELEDTQVEASGGHMFPQRWTIERTRHRGGWVLRRGERLTAPVVPGGSRARITLWVRFIHNSEGTQPIQIRAGDRLLSEWRPQGTDGGVWRRLEVGPVPWPAGAPLVIEALPVPRRGPVNGVIFDRAVFEWR